MRLQRLTSLEVEKLKDELASLEKLIAELKSILASDEKVLEIVKNEIIEVRDAYGDERKSEISTDYSEINIEDLIKREDVVVSMTHYGYIKRVPVTEYKAQKRGGKGMIAHKPKEEDFVENLFITNTHNDILFFTSKGRVYSLKGYEIPEGQKQAKGRAIINLLELTENEKVTAIIPLVNDMEGNLIQATKNGVVKKTSLEEYRKIRRVGKIAINLDEGDELVAVQITTGRDEILLGTKEGKCIKFSEQEVRTLSRDTRGVRSIALEKGDSVVDMIAIKPNHNILTVTENGYGKLCDPEEYRLQVRGGKGVKAGVFNEKTGKLVNMKQVTDDEDVMMIASNGVIMRTRAKFISKIGRDTVGVRIMRLKDDMKIVCVAIADSYADDMDGDDIEEGMEIAPEEI